MFSSLAIVSHLDFFDTFSYPPSLLTILYKSYRSSLSPPICGHFATDKPYLAHSS